MPTEKSATPASKPGDHELIERIYKIALEPHSYDDFMQKWDGHVSRAIRDLTDLRQQTEASHQLASGDVARHFEMGFRLLEELGRDSPATYFAERTPGPALPAILIDATGQVAWYNGSASRYFGLTRGATVDDLPVWEGSRGKLAEMIEGLSTGQNGGPQRMVLRLFSKDADRTLFMVATYTTDGGGDRLIYVRQAAESWREAVGQMLGDAFGLSAAELAIAECLVEGDSINEIAERRGNSVNTVRTQVKAILAKTGAGSQTELVRLLYSLIRIAQDDPASPQDTDGRPAGLRLSNGRLLPYHCFGPESGKPFLMLHGMLDGCGLTHAMIEQLRRFNIRIVAPERPYFGSAEGGRGTVRSAPDDFAADIVELLDHLDIGKVGLMGHMAGSLYAFAAAAHLGDRATAVVNVAGGVPIVSSDQFASMAPRQRLVAYTARYTPKLLPFVLRAGIRQLDFGGERSFMGALYENAPRDLETIADEEIFRTICSGYHFTVAQGHLAFETDSYHVVRDWSFRVEASDVPVVLVHGRHDPVVTLSSVEGFASRLGDRARLVVAEESGQLVFYANPKMVVEQLASV